LSALIWRVNTRRDFEQLRRGSRRRAGPLSVTVGPRDSARPPRVAYAIGRKVGTAPRRNLLRRRIRAILVAEGPRLERATYLITARPGAAELTFHEVQTHLTSALRGLHALSTPDHV
jgi:ribonuclease P protein component